MPPKGAQACSRRRKRTCNVWHRPTYHGPVPVQIPTLLANCHPFLAIPSSPFLARVLPRDPGVDGLLHNSAAGAIQQKHPALSAQDAKSCPRHLRLGCVSLSWGSPLALCVNGQKETNCGSPRHPTHHPADQQQQVGPNSNLTKALMRALQILRLRRNLVHEHQLNMAPNQCLALLCRGCVAKAKSPEKFVEAINSMLSACGWLRIEGPSTPKQFTLPCMLTYPHALQRTHTNCAVQKLALPQATRIVRKKAQSTRSQ